MAEKLCPRGQEAIIAYGKLEHVHTFTEGSRRRVYILHRMGARGQAMEMGAIR